MKILLFANTDWYLYNFRLSLARAVRDRGAEVVLVSPPGPYGQRLRDEGFRWVSVPMHRRSLNLWTEAKLVKLLVALYRSEQPDLAHHFTIKCVVYGSLAARAARVKGCVNAVVGMGYVFSSQSALARLLRPLVKHLLGLVLKGKRTRLILQNSDDCAEFLAQRLVQRERLRVIRGSGVDTARFRPRERCLREAASPLRVLLATRILWDKGVAEFVEAARLLKVQGIAVEFLLAGRPDDGNPDAVPAAMIADWERARLIQAVGHIEDVAPLLRQVDLVVLPSCYREGVPKILVEAAASGLPIVATDVPGCREIVEHEVNGLLVEPKSAVALAAAIARLAQCPEDRERFGAAGRAKAIAHFDEKIVIDATLAVYRELIPISDRATQEPLAVGPQSI